MMNRDCDILQRCFKSGTLNTNQAYSSKNGIKSKRCSLMLNRRQQEVHQTQYNQNQPISPQLINTFLDHNDYVPREIVNGSKHFFREKQSQERNQPRNLIKCKTMGRFLPSLNEDRVPKQKNLRQHEHYWPMLQTKRQDNQSMRYKNKQTIPQYFSQQKQPLLDYFQYKPPVRHNQKYIPPENLQEKIDPVPISIRVGMVQQEEARKKSREREIGNDEN